MSTQQPGSQAGDHVDVAPETPAVLEAARPAAPRGRWSKWHPAKQLPTATLALGFRRASLALLAALLLAGAGLVTYSVLSGNWSIAPILSGSMRPGFPVGGVVVAERIPTSTLAVGDVIIFQDPDRPSDQVVHRIVQLTVGQSGQPALRTKGDANTAEDPWTFGLKGTSVYVAQFTLPLLGYPAVNTNHGIDLIIGGLILLLIALSTVISHERRAAAAKARVGPDSPAPLAVVASAPDDRFPA
jgi:signal peptidase I